MMEYEKDLKINKHDLDNEWINQPFLQMKYVKFAVEAEIDMRRKKEVFEIKKAELYLAIRIEREMAKLKVTEAILDAEIKLDLDCKNKYDEYLTALELFKFLSGAVEAFQQRKSALENMVKLYLNNYFSHPKEKKENDIEKIQKESLQKIAKNKRRKK